MWRDRTACVIGVVVGAILGACRGADSESSNTAGMAGTPPTCPTSTLSAQLSEPDAGAGQRWSTLVFTNSGSEPCTMQGYVGLQLLDGNREPIPTDVVRGPGNETLVTLAAGGQAYTTLHWGVVASGNEPIDRPCQPDSVHVEITPPNETASLMLPWTFGPVCAQGRVETVPVQSGGG